MLTQAKLKDVIAYCPEDGQFRWAKSRPDCRVGDVAGCIRKAPRHLGGGYWQIKIWGKSYLAHRLAFLFITGSMPIEVDHENRIRHDNRWKNLRVASSMQNHCNVVGPRGNSKSGVRGVAWHKPTSKWIPHIQLNGKRKYFPRCDTIEQAKAVRRQAEQEIFEKFSP